MFRVKDLNGNIKTTGISKARVIDNRDPFSRGYIRIDHPLTGPSAWIPYLKTPTFFDVPSIGDVVYVGTDAGEGEYLIAWGNIIKGLKDANNTPTEFVRDIPTNRGIKTPGGHALELDDGIATITDNPDDTQFTTEKRGIRVTSTAGNKIHIIEDADAGQQYILLETTNGNFIKIDYKENKLDINILKDKQETIGGNVAENVTGNKNQTIGGSLTINVTGDVTMTCSNVTVTASGNATVDAGGSGTLKTGGAATVDAGGSIMLKSGSNAITGGVVTDNTANNDPITGIPLTGVGGVDAI